ncbi:MAG: hypothetical protein WCK15_20875 [Pirellula sp.]
MTKKKMLPRAMYIFRLRHESGKDQHSVFGRGNPQNQYIKAMKLERLTEVTFENLATSLSSAPNTKVSGAQLFYADENLSLEDQVLRHLLNLDPSHAVRKQISSKIKSANRGLPDDAVGGVYLLLYAHDIAKDVRNDLEQASKKWTNGEKADYQKLVELLGQIPSQGDMEAVPVIETYQTLLQADSAARKSLIDYAVQAVKNDQQAIDTLYAHFKLDNERRDVPFLIELLFPDKLEVDAADDVAPTTIMSFIKLAHNGLEGPLPSRDILLALRDVAICLSIPRKYRFEALTQYMQHQKIRQLPTMDLLISKQIMCRAFGIMSKPKNPQLHPVQIQARIALSKESIVDVDIASILGFANSSLLNQVQLPAGESLSGNTFFEQFCQGLAKSINIRFDQVPLATVVYDINKMLETYSGLQIQVCVFINQKRTETELSKLNGEFPLVHFVRLGFVEPTEFRTLGNNVQLADEILDGKFGSGGTTDII